MKKLIKLIFILLVLFLLGYFIYTNYINAIPKLNVEEEKVKVTDYHVYGNHLNIAGELEIAVCGLTESTERRLIETVKSVYTHLR